MPINGNVSNFVEAAYITALEFHACQQRTHLLYVECAGSAELGTIGVVSIYVVACMT